MNKLLVILGPTSTGKTDLALLLANKFKGELISCDSRQVYTGLDIGTGKIPSKFESLQRENGRWIIDGIPVHMYDVVNPKSQYTVADYVKKSKQIIYKISKNNKLPIVVGGTGLYLRALIEGFSNLSIPVDKQLRQGLERLDVLQLQDKLKSISPKKWQSLNYSDKQNPRRLIRAIEIEIAKPAKHLRSVLMVSPQSHLGSEAREMLKIGLTAEREVLYQRVDERVMSRINQGMIDEAKRLHKNSLSFKRMRQLGLEYGVLADFLKGQIQTKDELIKILQGKIHSFVRRQLTWFKKEKNINWFDITEKNYPLKVEKLIAKWYDSSSPRIRYA